VLQKTEEQSQQHISRQFANELDVEQQSDKNSFVEADAEDMTRARHLMQSAADESSVEPSPMLNHSAYIDVSQSDDDSQWPTANKGNICL